MVNVLGREADLKRQGWRGTSDTEGLLTSWDLGDFCAWAAAKGPALVCGPEAARSFSFLPCL